MVLVFFDYSLDNLYIICFTTSDLKSTNSATLSIFFINVLQFFQKSVSLDKYMWQQY